MRTSLSKRDIEQLLDDYDADPVGALSTALSKLTEASEPYGTQWESVLVCIPESVAPHSRLRARDLEALDAVVKHLVENRRLQK